MHVQCDKLVHRDVVREQGYLDHNAQVSPPTDGNFACQTHSSRPTVERAAIARDRLRDAVRLFSEVVYVFNRFTKVKVGQRLEDFLRVF